MKILIVSATFVEIKAICDKYQNFQKKDDCLSSLQINGNDTDILVTGIGIGSTAYQMGKIIGRNKYDFAFNFGIAGAFDKKLKIGDVVNAEEDIISELGAENSSSFLKFDELNIGSSSFGKTIWHVKNKFEIYNPVIQKLPAVKSITVNTVHGNNESIKKIVELFNPDIETMEGAVFLHICNAEKIKCAQIRSISNYVEERNTEYWNINLAIEKLNEAAFQILNSL